MSSCELNHEPSKKLCYNEFSCCFDCMFFGNDGDVYPCNACAAIGGDKCMYEDKAKREYWPQPHERC